MISSIVSWVESKTLSLYSVGLVEASKLVVNEVFRLVLFVGKGLGSLAKDSVETAISVD